MQCHYFHTFSFESFVCNSATQTVLNCKIALTLTLAAVPLLAIPYIHKMQPVPSLHYLIKADGERERERDQDPQRKRDHGDKESRPELWAFVKHPKTTLKEQGQFFNVKYLWNVQKTENLMCHCLRTCLACTGNTLETKKETHQSSPARRQQTLCGNFTFLSPGHQRLEHNFWGTGSQPRLQEECLKA